MSEIKDLRRQTDLNNLTYYFKNKDISRINFIGFKTLQDFYNRVIFHGNIELAKAEKDEKQFKWDLNERRRGNLKKKSVHQIKAIENI